MFIKSRKFYKIAKSTERILINLYKSKYECVCWNIKISITAIDMGWQTSGYFEGVIFVFVSFVC